MVRDEHLKSLFRAFSEGCDSTFLRVAETIISDELAANHHGLANELRKAISQRCAPHLSRPVRRELASMPKDRRNGEPLISLQEGGVSQDQIILNDETRKKIERILEEHRKSKQLADHGYRAKNKILFWGPPGCGKTFTARYVAHELGKHIGIIRLNAVISSFLGDTASHIQRVFDLATSSPMVLLLDEVDAVAKDRDDPNDVGELKRVVNSLLQAMDFFLSTQSLIIAASNHQYLLDPAAWRRFDDIVHFPMPGKDEREQHLRLLLNGVEFNGSFAHLAKMLHGISFADVEHITIDAVKTMILQGKRKLSSNIIIKEYRAFKRDITSAMRKSRKAAGKEIDQ
ncbi:MAG TPA: ATP-binding protein [bacterium]|nr:ATP-binding protein [bacterium]